MLGQSRGSTLEKPGSLPTMTRSVLPETALVTRPPKEVIIWRTRSLPSSSPHPPPTCHSRPRRSTRFRLPEIFTHAATLERTVDASYLWRDMVP